MGFAGTLLLKAFKQHRLLTVCQGGDMAFAPSKKPEVNYGNQSR